MFARDIEITENGVSFELRLRNAEYIQINLRMHGHVQRLQRLVRGGVRADSGRVAGECPRGAGKHPQCAGRIEMLPTNTPYRVILDYAHAPDALSNILRTCRTFTKKRVDCALRLRRRPR